MTIHAQPVSPHAPRDERPTRDLAPEPPLVRDAFGLLDHRTRSRAVPLTDAPPGRYLSAEHGDDIRLIPLDRPIVHIGRGLSADVRLEDPHVSRRHAIIAQRGDSARVLDDRSANGTCVNGRPVTVGHLHDGDVLRLGRVVLRYVEIAPPAPARTLRRVRQRPNPQENRDVDGAAPLLVEIRRGPYTA